MKEISMHILDIVMNSVHANASMIELTIEESDKNNYIKITITDNGVGMTEEILNKVIDPFYTTRTTRRVGLGIPMLKENCERCNGYFKINSILNKGTSIECYFEKNNIDRAPIGNMGDTIMTIINSLANCELLYKHETDEGTFLLSTVELKDIVDGSLLNSSAVLLWIKEYVNENIACISKK